MRLTVEHILKATSGQLIQGQKQKMIRSLSIDSRKLTPGDLFVAIRGQRLDGHDFIEEVIPQKPSAMILSKIKGSYPSDITVIKVEETTRALGRIARYHRSLFKIPVVAITGSCGKTTTKEMIAAVLSARFNVLKSEGSENNQIGVPLSLLKLDNTHQMVVIEMGTNQFGDIAWLTHIAEPTVAVLTNIGASHLERLKSPEGVFKEKLSLVKGLSSQGLIIRNGDDPYLSRIKPLLSEQKVISFGYQREFDFWVGQLKQKNNRALSFQVNGRYPFSLRSPVEHNVLNALSAIACGRHFQISFEQIALRLRDLSFPYHRQTVKKIGNNWVIDDTYNANPFSVISAIQTLRNLKTPGKKILVCADMLELGIQSRDYHHRIGTLVGESQVDVVITTGAQARWISRAARQVNPQLISYHYDSLFHLHQRLKKCCQAGDAILVKGSRAMKMERTMNHLEEICHVLLPE